jgi:hypothetical protein
MVGEYDGIDSGGASFDEEQTEVPAEEAQAPQAQSFYEIDEVPEELRESYDRMQAAYTQQRQKDTEALRNMRGEVEKFQGLLTDPNKLRAYLGALEAQSGVGGTESATPSPLQDHPGAEYRERMDEDTITNLDYMIQERIEARVGQLLPEIQGKLSAIDKIQQERVAGEWQQLVKKYPVAQELEGDPGKINRIQAIMETGASMEDALLAVAGQQILAAERKRAALQAEPAARRAAGAMTSMPGGAPMRGNNTGKSKARLMDAIKSYRRGGV